MGKRVAFVFFMLAGFYGLYSAAQEFYTNGVGESLYHKLMISSIMFYAASETKRLCRSFASYVKTKQPASPQTIALQLISGVLFLLWITS